MTRRRRGVSVGLGVALLLAAGACGPVAPPPAPTAPPSPPEPERVGSPASPAREPSPPSPAGRLQVLLDAVNRIRTDRGLHPLHSEPRLEAAARAHARDLAAVGGGGHQGSDGSWPAERASRAGYPWVLVGENVAWGVARPEAVVSGWMASPAHRDNLLTPEFQEVGIAVDEGGPEMGRVWVLVLGTRGPS